MAVERDPTSGVWRWALADARHRRSQFWLAGAVFTVVTATCGVLLTAALPSAAKLGQRVLAGVEAAAVGIGAVMTLSLIVALIVAPYQQRNTLRQRLQQLSATPFPRVDEEARAHRERIVAMVQRMDDYGDDAPTLQRIGSTDTYAYLLDHLADDPWVKKLRTAVELQRRRDQRERCVRDYIAGEVGQMHPEWLSINLATRSDQLLRAVLYDSGYDTTENPEFAPILSKLSSRRWSRDLKRMQSTAYARWQEALRTRPRPDHIRQALTTTTCLGCEPIRG